MIYSTIKGKTLIAFLIAIFILNCCSLNPLFAQDKNQSVVLLADPTVYNHNGTYYLYGTVERNVNNGFIVYTSTNLKTWKKDTTRQGGFALKKGDTYGNKNFWAPQVFIHNNIFYMAYVANENIAIATSQLPGGPFVQKVLKPLDAPVKQIDPFLFIDTDGKKYLYHVRLTNGNRIFVAEMEDDLSAIKTATLTECITATEHWENTPYTSWPVTEGPSVLKHNNLYYLFYTANDFRNPGYAVGYATSTTPFGPWKKYAGNPIIDKNILGINGTGHGDFVMDTEHNLVYVFHTHFSDSAVGPRRTALINTQFIKDKKTGIDKMVIDKKSFHYAIMGK